MAILRDAVRLSIMEPFARWKLSRDLQHRRAQRAKGLSNDNVLGEANGDSFAVHANGNACQNSQKELRQMHRSVLRFAEQGWSALYYIVQFSYGLVCAGFFRVLSE
jgi:acyl-CoA-dependent ceramide synthase